MRCQRINSSNLAGLPLNPTQEAYLCEEEKAPNALAMSPPPPSPRPGPSLAKSTRLFAAGPQDPPPPRPQETPSLVTLLKELTTQLKDFELTTTIKLPIEGLSHGGPVNAFVKAVLKDQGALVLLDVDLQPSAGPIPLVPPLHKVPILSPFFRIKVLKVFMDPETRHLNAKVCYVVVPFSKDVHAMILDMAKLSEATLKGDGYDLNQGIPLYSWQILDLFLKSQKEWTPDKAGALEALGKKMEFGPVTPRIDQAEISLTGDFSNQTVSFNGVHVFFAPLDKSQKHRITVSGKLLDPVIKIQGLKEAEIRGELNSIRFTNAESPVAPLVLQAHFDLSGKNPPVFEIPSYKSKDVFIETSSPRHPNLKVRLQMEEGLEVEGASITLDPKDPKIAIRKIVARKLRLDGYGNHLETSSGDEAILQEVRMDWVDNEPRFTSKIEGEASGYANYFIKDEEVGRIQFKYLRGKGSLSILRDPEGDPHIVIEGNIATQIPELKFLARSEKMAAFSRIIIADATVSGDGRVEVVPTRSEILIESRDPSIPVSLNGSGGSVWFHQDPSEVAEWPELKEKLGIKARDVTTDMHVDASRIRFDFRRMGLKSTIQASTSKPALEIIDADFGPIEMTGDVWGRLFTHIPGGYYMPILIDQKARMVDAKVAIGRLRDRVHKETGRSVDFWNIAIEGSESEPTFSPKDQKRCGIDRQHIHALLDFFSFQPEDRTMRIGPLDPHFHIYLKDRLNGGCFKIGAAPSPVDVTPVDAPHPH